MKYGSFEKLPNPSNYFEGIRSADPLHVDNVLFFYRPNLLEAHTDESSRWLHSRHILVANFGEPGVAHLNMIPYRVDTGSAILIRPYELHFFTALEHPLSAWLFMTFDTETPLAFKTEGHPVVAFSKSQKAKLERLTELSRQRLYRSLRANEFIARASEFLESLRPQWSRRKSPSKSQTKTASTSLLTQISDQLKANPSLSLSIAQLAVASNYSERHLRRMFQDQTGMPLGAFLKEYRIAQIIQLVDREGRSLTEAAATCGYSAPSALTRAFKQHTGLTPRDFFKRST